MSSTDHAISGNDADLANWICASISLAILLLRLIAHRHKQHRFDVVAYAVILSTVTLVARTICNTLILNYGTINSAMSVEETSRVRTGSILTLVARVLVTTYYWLQSIILLLFYREMLNHLSWINKTIKLCWAVVGLTYLAVILATFLECRPINLYWTYVPGTDEQCVRAYVQILLQCICNATIDVLLLIISAPILKAQARAFPRNLQLGTLYILGFFCIIVIGLKIHYIYKDGSVQHARSFWASIQVLVSTFVANAPSIYGAAKNVKRRKESIVSLSLERTRTWEDEYARIDDALRRPPEAMKPRKS